MERKRISVDEDKINRGVLITLFGIVVISCFAYTISMLVQKKDLVVTLQKLGIFAAFSFGLNIISALLMFIFKKDKD